MAYTNATFYLDLVNGNDAARAGITPTAYANNGSGLVRVTKTAHGLVTDAVVTIAGTTSSVYAGDWKITKVDNDNFDLQGSTYTSNPATKGTVTPFGGMSWTDAWKTINNGATAARIAPGDTIRTAKTADPTSIGNATWTSKSATVTLASALTANIYMDGAWTAANSATSTTTTTRKEGATAASITTSASTVANTKYAYYATGTLDLSSYDAITLWFQNRATGIGANAFVIKLCSDTTGDTAVDVFAIPDTVSTNSDWFPVTLTRTGGGNLGASIQSIALYTGSVSPGNSFNVYIDNVLACSSTGLNLTSLISKSSAGHTLTETWHPLQSINGTTVILGETNGNASGNANLKGYYTAGTSPETVTTYVRPTFKFTMGTTSAGSYVVRQPISESGTAGNLITFSGGWNTSSNTQDGITWIDGQNGNAYGFGKETTINYIRIERFGMCRFNRGFSFDGNSEIDNCITAACSNNYALTSQYTNSVYNNCGGSVTATGSYLDNILAVNHNGGTGFINAKIGSIYVYNTAGVSLGGCFIGYLDYTANSLNISAPSAFIKEAVIKDNTGSAMFGNNNNILINKLTSSGNTATAAFVGTLTVKQTTSSPQIIGLPSTSTATNYQLPTTAYSLVGGDVTDHRAYWFYGNAISQTTTRHTASGIAWQINITNTGQTSNLPALYPIAKVAVNASSLVTVKAWVKLSHATDIGAKLLVQANEIPGVTADVTATKTADTNWEELTITFTPTVKGVVQVYLAAYWLANTANQSVYVDDITVTQA